MGTRILGLALLAASLLAAKDYTITLFEPAVVGGKQLTAGEYKLELRGDTAVFKNRGQTVESPVQVVQSSRKYPTTAVRLAGRDGGNRIEEIRIGGTTTRVIFDETAAHAPSSRAEHGAPQ